MSDDAWPAFDDLERRLAACRQVTLQAIALQAESRLLARQLAVAVSEFLAVAGHDAAPHARMRVFALPRDGSRCSTGSSTASPTGLKEAFGS